MSESRSASDATGLALDKSLGPSIPGSFHVPDSCESLQVPTLSSSCPYRYLPPVAQGQELFVKLTMGVFLLYVS